MTTELAKPQECCSTKPESQSCRSTYSPRVDIWESDEELLLYADLPGVAPEDLDIQFENHELVIHGKVNSRNESAQPAFTEYGIGDFHRKFSISDAVDESKVFAELNNGVLELHLPKADAVKSRRIEVKTN